VRHISEDWLERYSMGTLPEPQSGSLEEHLLICEDCQDRLRFLDQFIAAFRAAAAD
jgi:anti-sigma factor RsiW